MQTLGKWLSSAAAPVSKRRNLVFSNVEEEQIFESRMLDTIVWCSKRLKEGDPASTLRSAQLKPDLMLGEGADASWDHTNHDVIGAVSRLSEKRSSLLKSDPQISPKDTGKLLVFWTEETLDCGTAACISKGYFDVGNAPPWDTWFWYGPLRNQPPALISWVPDELIDLVARGISANPEKCIDWLEAA